MPDRVVAGKALLFDEKIRGIVEMSEIGNAEVIDAEGMYVAPGLVDIHIHGYLGRDASDGDEQGLIAMAEGIVKNGVTSWLPT
ncbi:MAG: amidohydrolase family protein, partial [Clostridiales bacterium]|nr:amidohydrolase family protein [Clostridiales bacterium]